MIFNSVGIFETLETLREQLSRMTNALRVVASKKELERKREITGRLPRDLPLAKEPSSKRANRALPCFFQRFYKCYRCLGRTGPTQAAGARGERGPASRVPDAGRATPRRAPSRPTSSTTAANRRASSARTAASLARRSSTFRITLGTSTRRSRSSATRSSRTSRAAGYGASERQLPREHRFNACDPPPRGICSAFPLPPPPLPPPLPPPDRPAKIDEEYLPFSRFLFLGLRAILIKRRPFCTCVLCNRRMLYMYIEYIILFLFSRTKMNFKHCVRVVEKNACIR